MRHCLSLLIVILTICTAYGQRIPVKGSVTDEAGKPLAGVSILQKGTKQFAVAKDDGSFTLTVTDPKSAVLVLTYTGYISKEVPLNGASDVTISLLPNKDNLNEVTVVSALGLTRKAKSVGYSQQSVDVGRLTETRDVNITNMLAGKVAGLQVTTTGQPTGSTRVIIRGENSITGNNQPLWVVDGVPIANNMGDVNNAGNSRGDNLDYGNGAMDLNPDDIESIEVLKGPNAAALYGSKAANGAILVTTKKAKQTGDKTLGLSVSQNMTFTSVLEYPEYQNVYGEGGSFRMASNTTVTGATGAINMGTGSRSWGGPMLGQPYNTFGGVPIPTGYVPQPDNIRNLYKTGTTSITNVAVSKADANGSFRLSYTRTGANDILEKQNLRTKNNFSLTASRKLGSRVTVDTRILYTSDNVKNRTLRNMDANSPMQAYIYMVRSMDNRYMAPWKDDNGNAFNLGSQGDAYENPYWAIYENANEDKSQRLIGGVTTTIDITKYLKFRAQISGDIAFRNGYVYRELGGRITKNGFYSHFNQKDETWNTEGLFIYNQKLGTDFTLTANLGTNFLTYNSLARNESIAALLQHDMPSISNANANPTASESQIRSKTQSVYGSAGIGFRDFLFVDVTGRNDWSSTLPPDSRSFFYPSVSGSFVFTEFLNRKSILNFGKLRASIAQVGNDAGPYQLYSTFSSASSLFLGNPSLFYNTQLKNAKLKPERTTSKEIGADLAFFNNKIRLNASVYQNNTVDQIIRASVTPETGFTQQTVNSGEMQNKGIELTLLVTPVKTKNFSWDVIANWSTNKNEVLSLTPGVTKYNLGSWFQMYSRAVVGQPYGALEGNAAMKVNDTLVVNPSGNIYSVQNTPMGSVRPKWIGSFGSTFRYKDFDFSFLVTAKWGGNLFSVSNHKANVTGNTIASLYGRDDYFFSSIILGENGNEQKGLEAGNYNILAPYADASRPKGSLYDAYIVQTNAAGVPLTDGKGNYLVGRKNDIYILPQTFWQSQDGDMTRNMFNATNIRVSELVLGYTAPKKLLVKSFFQSARFSVVARNLITLLKYTPRGIDPEAANTAGNGQGIEQGGALPYTQYGFDLKLSF